MKMRRLLAVGRAFRPAHAAAGRAKALPHIRRVVTVLLAVVASVGSSSPVFACPVCFGAEETSLIDATKLGIVVLLTVTLSVQGAFVGFFIYLRRRAKRVADMDLDTEWSELQGASRTP